MIPGADIDLPDKHYFKIGETASLLGIKPHVLRYWETEFEQIKPHKSPSGQRLYKKKDVELICEIRKLLYFKKFTIAGAKTAIKNNDNISIKIDQSNNIKDDLHIIKKELKKIYCQLST